MNPNIALLGLSGSGKSEFIAAARKDINIFSPQMMIERMKTVADAAENASYTHYEYRFRISDSIQWDFTINDYIGDLLKVRAGNDTVRNNIIQSLQRSDCWVILIDGALFESGTTEEITNAVRKKCARYFVPLISEYADSHYAHTPYIVFMITKANQYLLRFINENGQKEISEIVTSAFNGIITENRQPFIMMSETDTTKTAGLALLLMFYLQYNKDLTTKTNLLRTKNHKIELRIKQLDSLIASEDSNFLSDKDVIQAYRNEIEQLKKEQKSNQFQITKYLQDPGKKNLSIAVHRLMLRHTALLVSGFDQMCFTYDDSVETGNFEVFWSGLLVVFNILIGIVLLVIIAIAMFTSEDTSLTEAVSALIGGCIWLFFTIKAKNFFIKLFCALGVIGGLITGFYAALGAFGIKCICAFVVWVLLSTPIASKMDKKRAIKMGKQPTQRFKDQLVAFYDDAAKKVR